MAYWLVKSEPGTWSWDDQMRAGRTHWDGVRNAQALGNMRRMALGDEAFFYHSGKERRIVGIVRIVRAFYDDPNDPKSGLVDVATVTALKRPVTLAEIKADPAFADLALVRQPRLSVMPVSPAQWQRLLAMGGMEG
ncbi:MAG: EVE domain-containing protein [Alphaproteobacteria bacterium]|nr:MAG: EVE domain-containing protein [Alphaproteobacteria bacterium]